MGMLAQPTERDDPSRTGQNPTWSKRPAAQTVWYLTSLRSTNVYDSDPPCNRAQPMRPHDRVLRVSLYRWHQMLHRQAHLLSILVPRAPRALCSIAGFLCLRRLVFSLLVWLLRCLGFGGRFVCQAAVFRNDADVLVVVSRSPLHSLQRLDGLKPLVLFPSAPRLKMTSAPLPLMDVASALPENSMADS